MSKPRDINLLQFYNKETLELNLKYSGITDQDISFSILPFLENYPVATLNLSGNSIGPYGAQLLAFNSSASLKCLLLAGNEVGDAGAIAFSVNQSLETLDLSSNKIGFKGAEGLALNRYIKNLDLYNNNLGNLGAKAFMHSKFRSLNLRKNKIGDDGAYFIALNRYIEILDLSINDISDRGAFPLAHNQYLKSLSLKANLIGNQGAFAFAKQNYLENLNVSWNNIEDLGALKLATNLHFKVLNLKENNLTEACIEMLIHVTPNPMIRANFRLQFAKSLKLPTLINLCLFKLNQSQNVPSDGPIKSLICENRNLSNLQMELNNFEFQLKSLVTCFNLELKIIMINADEDEAEIKKKVNLYIIKEDLINKINQNLEKINDSLLEFNTHLSRQITHEKWASLFLEDYQSKSNNHKDKIKAMTNSCAMLKRKMQIINDTLKNIKHIQSNEFSQVNGNILKIIKSWISKNQNYLNLINRWKKMPEDHPKRKNLLCFLEGVANSQDLDQIAKFISTTYRSYWSQYYQCENDQFIKEINEEMRRTTLFSSNTASSLDELGKDFLKYLKENYQYQVPTIPKEENHAFVSLKIIKNYATMANF